MRDGVRFTNLFGGNCGLNDCDWGKIAAPDPYDTAIEFESGPTLDRSLPCRDSGRRERRRIQEAFVDENEALGVSGIVLKGESPCREAEGVLLLLFWGETTREDLGRWYRDRGGLETTGDGGTECCCELRVTNGDAAELVPGRKKEVRRVGVLGSS